MTKALTLLVLTVGVALLLAPRGGANTSSCTRVNDLIAQHPDHFQLGSGTYDNSCADLIVPDGYRLTGQGNSTLVLLRKGPQDVAQIGQQASVGQMKWVVNGSPNDVQDGVNPCPGCWGVRMLSHSWADHMTLMGTTLGFMLSADHVHITNSTALKNYYGVFQDIGNSQGNADLEDDDLTGNAQAGIGIHPWAQLDSAYLRNVHLGFERYCWFADEGLPGPHEYAVTNIDDASESCESPHDAGYDFGSRKTSGVWTEPHTSWDATSGGPIWESAAPLPGREFGAQTLIVGAGGDMTNGPLLGPMNTQ